MNCIIWKMGCVKYADARHSFYIRILFLTRLIRPLTKINKYYIVPFYQFTRFSSFKPAHIINYIKYSSHLRVFVFEGADYA